ncbi:glycosyltransferase BC10-like [Tasmannia lanceolata]|uniref:glycosyltransferase BC10-like n=1 Tax=Tasmannia lanceolata TaxID=3420 RepID=UPI0040641143
MKESKESAIMVKELTLRSRREMREGSLQITTLVLIFLSLVLMGFFISFQARKFVISEEISSPQMDKFTPFVHSFSSPSLSIPLFSNYSSSSYNFSDWIAPKQLRHSMTDEELMWRASIVPRINEYPYERIPKVAFMFLTRGRLPLGPIWERFFKGHQGLFSIYLHSSPEFAEEPPETSVFFGRRIPSKPVEWGRSSMINAERRLLANALLDFSNERFILLSETCIPLFNFTTIYDYLINSNHTFIGSFDDPRKVGRGRYNKRMWPVLSINDWRKGSQWFESNRKIAVEMVSDKKYYAVFREHCRPPCYMDEHYFSTLVTKLFPELNSNRSITWVDWSRGGSHPASFGRKDVTVRFLNRVRFGSNCAYNGTSSSICFLFARKFVPSTLGPLLRIAPGLFGFDP